MGSLFAGIGGFDLAAEWSGHRTIWTSEIDPYCVALLAERFPDAPALYAARGWQLPESIGRVYDPSAIQRDIGFRCATDFAAVLAALREGEALPFTHDPGYVPPKERAR